MTYAPSLPSIAAVAAAAALLGHPAAAQNAPVRITASDAQPGSYYGLSAAIDGNTVVTTAYLHDGPAGVDSGAAYVYQREHGGPNAWGEIATLVPSGMTAGYRFGVDADIDGDLIITGAPFDDELGGLTGAAYVFARDAGGPDAWEQVARLTSSTASAGDTFGFRVAIDGDTVVVGAYGEDDAGGLTGAAYIFECDYPTPGTWGQVARLVADPQVGGAQFGIDVAISGDTVAVGAYFEGPGAVYVYDRNNGGPNAWGLTARLTADDGSNGERFGERIGLDGDLLVATAGSHQVASGEYGAAYVFERDAVGGPPATGGWAQTEKFTGGVAGQFARNVAVGGDQVSLSVEGASPHVPMYDRTEAFATVYSVDPGSLSQPASWGGDAFGSSQSIGNAAMVVGAYADAHAGGDNSGAIYIFDTSHLLIEPFVSDCNGNGINDIADLFVLDTSQDCNGNGIPDECDIAAATSLDDDGDGIPDECADSCASDSTNDGLVDVNDLLELLAAWGACP